MHTEDCVSVITLKYEYTRDLRSEILSEIHLLPAEVCVDTFRERDDILLMLQLQCAV